MKQKRLDGLLLSIESSLTKTSNYNDVEDLPLAGGGAGDNAQSSPEHTQYHWLSNGGK